MAVKRKTSSRATGTRASAKRGKKPAAKASALTRTARKVRSAVGRTDRAARSVGRTTGKAKASLKKKTGGVTAELSRLRRKKARAKSASKSRLTKVAVAVGTALGRTERVVRNAGKGAADAKDAFEAKITAISEQLGRAGTEFKRTVARKRR